MLHYIGNTLMLDKKPRSNVTQGTVHEGVLIFTSVATLEAGSSRCTWNLPWSKIDWTTWWVRLTRLWTSIGSPKKTNQVCFHSQKKRKCLLPLDHNHFPVVCPSQYPAVRFQDAPGQQSPCMGTFIGAICEKPYDLWSVVIHAIRAQTDGVYVVQDGLMTVL